MQLNRKNGVCMDDSFNFPLPIAESAEEFPVGCSFSQGVLLCVEIAHVTSVTVIALVSQRGHLRLLSSKDGLLRKN